MPWWQGATDHEIMPLIGSKICCYCIVIVHFFTLFLIFLLYFSYVVCLWLDVSCVVSCSCAVSIIGILFVVSAMY
jgi:hypothetical protein